MRSLDFSLSYVFLAELTCNSLCILMVADNSVNGIPTCLSPLMKAARDAWGFKGYVTSDSDAVGDAYSAHHFTKTAGEASCLAIKNGGCDIDSGNTYFSSLTTGIADGYCTMTDVDKAVFNTMRVRCVRASVRASVENDEGALRG